MSVKQICYGYIQVDEEGNSNIVNLGARRSENTWLHTLFGLYYDLFIIRAMFSCKFVFMFMSLVPLSETYSWHEPIKKAVGLCDYINVIHVNVNA